VVANHSSWRPLSVWHWPGMAPAHLRTRADHLYESFGTTYYSLVGLHAFHVTAGLVMLSIVLIFGLAGRVGADQSVALTCSLCIGILSMRYGSWSSPWFTLLGAEGKKWQLC